jgi:serine/tyrosine/threonine adenylyltransferase
VITGSIALPLQRPTFAELEGLFTPWAAAAMPDPRLVVLNEPLAAELGLDVEALRAPAGVGALVGQLPEGTLTIAQAYAGHQFGGFSSSLGDGRALLLGELVDRDGRPRELHLKGSGATPYSRGGDGRAALGPMLREHLVSEAMHALGIPTTRALAVVATGEPVAREVLLPGAVLAREASSHLRVGSFQYASVHGDMDLLRRLADHAIARHHPAAADAADPYVALFDAVVDAQAALVARWMLVGFVHGVMNTDNMTISGETIDYGPCAFMEAYDPATVFSSIDHGGRYAYGNQPAIAHWDLARLGEAMLPLFADELEPAVAAANGVLATWPERYHHQWLGGMRAKVGLATAEPADAALVDELLAILAAQRVDMTSAFRALSSAVRGDEGPVTALLADQAPFAPWAVRWRARLAGEPRPAAAVAAAMDRVNPRYLPRNRLVEDALAAATAGDLAPYELLLDVVTHPFEERAGCEPFAAPSPLDAARYRTFCGT